jgi:hypothetical protein
MMCVQVTAAFCAPNNMRALEAAAGVQPSISLGLSFVVSSPCMPALMLFMQVTVAFCAPEGMRALEAATGRAAKQALEMFCSAVRTTLSACRGYECQEKDGIFMLAFSDTGKLGCGETV